MPRSADAALTPPSRVTITSVSTRVRKAYPSACSSGTIYGSIISHVVSPTPTILVVQRLMDGAMRMIDVDGGRRDDRIVMLAPPRDRALRSSCPQQSPIPDLAAPIV